MAENRLKLTREQLSKFLKDQKAIKQFEQLFTIVDEIAPDVVNEVSTAAANAQNAANEALGLIQRVSDTCELNEAVISVKLNELTGLIKTISNSLELIALAPAKPEFIYGTMANQDSDDVAITGGTISAQITDNQDTLIASSTTLSDSSGVGVGMLTNTPTAGNPTKWISINDNGTTRYIPTWT
jgi:hypothetical protein